MVYVTTNINQESPLINSLKIKRAIDLLKNNKLESP